VVVVEEKDGGVDIGGGGCGGECNCSCHEIMAFVPDVAHSVSVTMYQK
jgi:hypothetical protein